MIAGMRNPIAHAYFDVDLALVWDIVRTRLDPLEGSVRRLLGS